MSLSGYIFMLAGGPINLRWKRQPVVAQSSKNAEVVALSMCIRELLCFR